MPAEAIWSAGQRTSHGFSSAAVKEVRLVVFVRGEEEVAPASSVLFACSEKATHLQCCCVHSPLTAVQCLCLELLPATDKSIFCPDVVNGVVS